MNCRSIAFVAVALLMCGCGYQSVQKIQGQLQGESVPISGKRIGLATGANYKNCKGIELEAVADSDGRFQLSRTLLRSRIDPYVRTDALCIYEQDRWIAIWHSIYGPAPEAMEFKCTKSGAAQWKCTMNGYPSDGNDV
jgi:hypothetical protein